MTGELWQVVLIAVAAAFGLLLAVGLLTFALKAWGAYGRIDDDDLDDEDEGGCIACKFWKEAEKETDWGWCDGVNAGGSNFRVVREGPKDGDSLRFRLLVHQEHECIQFEPCRAGRRRRLEADGDKPPKLEVAPEPPEPAP